MPEELIRLFADCRIARLRTSTSIEHGMVKLCLWLQPLSPGDENLLQLQDEAQAFAVSQEKAGVVCNS